MATRLVDLANAAIGNVVLGVPKTAEYSARAAQIRSGGNAMVGDQRVDKGPFDISCTLSAEDPLSVPVVAALTTAQAVTASGRISGGATAQKFTLVHGVLVSVGLNIQEDQSATVTYGFRNRGATGTSAMTPLAALAQELQIASGTARVAATRGRVIQFASGALFTPDEGDPVTLPIKGLQWNAQGDVAVDRDTGELIITQLDVAGWSISGSITLQDQTIIEASGLSTSDYLAALGRGTLTVPLKLAGQGHATPPTNQVLTAARVQFYSSSGRQQEGANFAENSAEFDAETSTDAGVAMTLAQMLTYAAAT
jgi:hypothetical protein